MTPQEFAFEQWKVYEGYIERKERLIQVATTIYLAFVSALILRENDFWLRYKPKGIWFLLLLFLTSLAVLWFVWAQLRHRTRGARISNASQSMASRWLALIPKQSDLDPETLPEFSGVEWPAALARDIRERGARPDRSPRQWWADSAFEIVVYGLIVLWTIVLFVRISFAWEDVKTSGAHVMQVSTFLNAAGLIMAVLAALLMAWNPPRGQHYTPKGELVTGIALSPTEEGRRHGERQDCLSRLAPWLLAFGFLLQFAALLIP